MMRLLWIVLLPPLWACQPVDREQILARHVAEVAPAFRALPPETPLLPVPTPGSVRTLRAADWRRLEARYQLSGPLPPETCFEWPVAPLRPDVVISAMQRALAPLSAEIEVRELLHGAVPAGELVFDRSALPRPSAVAGERDVLWRGLMRYGERSQFTVWARVVVRVSGKRLVAVTALRAGSVIGADQVRVESYRGFPLDGEVAERVEEAVGKRVRGPVAAGAPLRRSWLESPPEIAKGDLVEVEVVSGNTRLRLDEATAETSGRRGELIAVRNPASGKTFRARVAAHGKAVVVAGSPVSLSPKEQSE